MIWNTKLIVSIFSFNVRKSNLQLWLVTKILWHKIRQLFSAQNPCTIVLIGNRKQETLSLNNDICVLYFIRNCFPANGATLKTSRHDILGKTGNTHGEIFTK